MSKVRNEEIALTNDKTDIDKLLIGLGIPVDILNWYEEDSRNYEHAPID